MTSTVSSTNILNIKAILLDTIGVADSISITHNFVQQTLKIESGSQTNQIDLAFTIATAITGGADTYNLDDGSLNNVVGEALYFNSIHLIAVKNTDAANDFVVTLQNVSGTDDLTVPVANGGDFVWLQPNGSSGGISDLVITGTTGGTYELLVLGQSGATSSISSEASSISSAAV